MLRTQAVFYVITGLWPLVSLRTFELVTGPKVDDWLVHMVGLLVAAIGATLWVGARRDRPSAECVLLAALSAASFAAIDVRYALAGRISAVYLLDAAAELMLILALTAGWLRRSRAQ